MRIFDRALVRRRRDRAAAGFADHDFLIREISGRLVDRLADLDHRVTAALDLGCHTGQLAAALAASPGLVDRLVQCDLSPRMAAHAAARGIAAIVADEEALPFAPASFDLVLSCLSLHWVNDLPGTLAQIRRILRPGGLFLAALPGAGSLAELRAALRAADPGQDPESPGRVSPFADIRALGDLLPRAGFIRPVADCETVTIRYADPMRLLDDLRGMGESDAQCCRVGRRPLPRTRLETALRHYAAHQGGNDGRVAATVDVVTLTGWAPSD